MRDNLLSGKLAETAWGDPTCCSGTSKAFNCFQYVSYLPAGVFTIFCLTAQYKNSATTRTSNFLWDFFPHLQGAKNSTPAHLADLFHPLCPPSDLWTFESWLPCPLPSHPSPPFSTTGKQHVCEHRMKNAPKLWTAASCYDTTTNFTIFNLAQTQLCFLVFCLFWKLLLLTMFFYFIINNFCLTLCGALEFEQDIF